MSESSQEVPGSPSLGDTETESLYGAAPDGSDQEPGENEQAAIDDAAEKHSEPR